MRRKVSLAPLPASQPSPVNTGGAALLGSGTSESPIFENTPHLLPSEAL